MANAQPPAQTDKPLRIAVFGFRSIPLKKGCAGADKFASEFYPRLAARGHKVVGYNRMYPGDNDYYDEFKGVKMVSFRTVDRSGFDTLVHSFKASWDIILKNRADIVHIHNGGNSIWAALLRLFGKKVFISQDGIDWKRDKWPWYGKLYLYLSAFVTANLPNGVIFDNIFSRELFEEKFRKRKHFMFIPYGSEVPEVKDDPSVLEAHGLKKGEYILFVGRFIPDKGLHYLLEAFTKVKTDKKLVLVGGPPNPSDYSDRLRKMADDRVLFPGFLYGDHTTILMQNAYLYVQPSDVEGLSPVVLTIMGLGTPLLCSDIKENLYIIEDTALTFKQASPESLREQLEYALAHPGAIAEKAERARARAYDKFNWEKITDEHVEVFRNA